MLQKIIGANPYTDSHKLYKKAVQDLHHSVKASIHIV